MQLPFRRSVILSFIERSQRRLTFSH